MAEARAVFGLHLGGGGRRTTRATTGTRIRLGVSLVVALGAGLAFAIAVGLVSASAFGLDEVDRWLAGDVAWLRAGSIAGAAFLVGVAAIAVGARRERHRNRRHVVASGERGMVVVDSRSVATMAAAAARSCDGVIGLDAGVRGAGDEPVEVVIYASVIPGTDLEATGRQVQDAVRRAVEKLAGLRVRNIHISIEVAATDDLDRLLE